MGDLTFLNHLISAFCETSLAFRHFSVQGIYDLVFRCFLLLFFSALVTGSRRSLSLELSNTRVYEPQIRARGFGVQLSGVARFIFQGLALDLWFGFGV